MTVATVSRTDIRQAIGRTTRQLLNGDTFAVAVASPSQVNSTALPFANSDDPKGMTLYTYVGGGLGQARTVVSANAVGAPSGSVLYLDRDLSPVPSTNTSFELWKGISIPNLHQAIDNAMRQVQTRILLPVSDYGVILGDLLGHVGTFQRYPNGTTSPPAGWTLTDGTPTSVGRNTNREHVFSGNASFFVTVADSDATVYRAQIPNWRALGGETVSFKLFAGAPAASRLTVRISDGISTADSGAHDGNGWEGENGSELTATLAFADAPTDGYVELRITAGAVGTYYFGKGWLEGALTSYENELPAKNATDDAFVWVHAIFLEGETTGVFDVELPQMNGSEVVWWVDASVDPPLIRFSRNIDGALRTGGRQARIDGMAYPKLPASDTDQIVTDPEYVRLRAASEVFVPTNELDLARVREWRADAAVLLDRFTTPVPPNSIAVEVA